MELAGYKQCALRLVDKVGKRKKKTHHVLQVVVAHSHLTSLGFGPRQPAWPHGSMLPAKHVWLQPGHL